jgi:hypothetical protein
MTFGSGFTARMTLPSSGRTERACVLTKEVEEIYNQYKVSIIIFLMTELIIDSNDQMQSQ